MKKYGLIGKSLKHSFSRIFFEEYFNKNTIDAIYENIEIESIDQVNEIFQLGYSGLNVTIPYKEEIIHFLSEIDEEAREIGAVNTIKFSEDRTVGYNTDAYGFQQMIKPFLTNKQERCMIIGTGGASKAVVYGLKKIGIDSIFISRNPLSEHEYSYDEVNGYMISACKLIVNCTPVGMHPNENETVKIPYENIGVDHLVIDLIYNPEKTNFLQKAQQQGATILNGSSMLKHQALKSWEIWNSEK